MSGWYVYMVRCSDDTLYTGISKNVGKRIKEHNYDNALGSRYTRPRRPVTLAYQEAARSRSQATQRERQIRRLTRKQKEALIEGANLN
ncbi:MAG: GIY-YIG nuclease family protein [Acidiferrobacterales bacterium]